MALVAFLPRACCCGRFVLIQWLRQLRCHIIILMADRERQEHKRQRIGTEGNRSLQLLKEVSSSSPLAHSQPGVDGVERRGKQEVNDPAAGNVFPRGDTEITEATLGLELTLGLGQGTEPHRNLSLVVATRKPPAAAHMTPPGGAAIPPQAGQVASEARQQQHQQPARGIGRGVAGDSVCLGSTPLSGPWRGPSSGGGGGASTRPSSADSRDPVSSPLLSAFASASDAMHQTRFAASHMPEREDRRLRGGGPLHSGAIGEGGYAGGAPLGPPSSLDPGWDVMELLHRRQGSAADPELAWPPVPRGPSERSAVPAPMFWQQSATHTPPSPHRMTTPTPSPPHGAGPHPSLPTATISPLSMEAVDNGGTILGRAQSATWRTGGGRGELVGGEGAEVMGMGGPSVGFVTALQGAVQAEILFREARGFAGGGGVGGDYLVPPQQPGAGEGLHWPTASAVNWLMGFAGDGGGDVFAGKEECLSPLLLPPGSSSSHASRSLAGSGRVLSSADLAGLRSVSVVTPRAGLPPLAPGRRSWPGGPGGTLSTFSSCNSNLNVSSDRATNLMSSFTNAAMPPPPPGRRHPPSLSSLPLLHNFMRPGVRDASPPHSSSGTPFLGSFAGPSSSPDTQGRNTDSMGGSIQGVGRREQASSTDADHGLVKVFMDGVLVGRKINLQEHNTFRKLARAVNAAFSDMLGLRGSSPESPKGDVGGEGESPTRLKSFPRFRLVFEDKEGDIMTIGDLPWEIFLSSVRKLRVVRRSGSPPVSEGERAGT